MVSPLTKNAPTAVFYTRFAEQDFLLSFKTKRNASMPNRSRRIPLGDGKAGGYAAG